MSGPGGGGRGGVLFSKYIDNNILTPILSRLQVITEDERFRGSDLLEDLDGIRGLMGNLQTVFARMAENERSLVHLFDPIERLVDDVLESVAARDTDVGRLASSARSSPGPPTVRSNEGTKAEEEEHERIWLLHPWSTTAGSTWRTSGEPCRAWT
uniref:Uncharacterized protein n=1 Tax=Arundo donax TaxID=35708 RepID=A0A0A9HF35_ARUDO